MSNQNFGLQHPNHVYYTLNFRNNGQNGEAEDARVDYTETRNNPYLMSPDLYSCSIIRFSLTTATLPIFIPQMSEGFTNNPADDLSYNKTVYSVTMEYQGVTSRQYVKYIPQTIGPTINPSPPGDVNDAASNPYYYVYQVAQFIVMVNNALAKAFNAVVTLDASNNATKCPVYINWLDKQTQAIFFAPKKLCQEPGYASQPASSNSVVLAGPGTVGGISSGAGPWTATVTIASTVGLEVGQSVSATNGTGSLYGGTPTSVKITAIVPNTSFTYQVTGGTTPTAGTVTVITASPSLLKVWFNAPLFNYFSSFQAQKEPFRFATQGNSNGKHFRFQWWNFYNSTEQAANTFEPPNFLGRNPAAEEYIAINQSYSTVPLMNPVKSIVFTTALLPCLPELVSAPQTIGATTNFTNDGNNANVQNILTDFEVELINGEETRPVVQYVPTAEYRMVDLQSNQPLTSIQLSVNWRNKFGTLIPLSLGSDGNAQIKMLFRRRDWQS
jgi:hypothetical protein